MTTITETCACGASMTYTGTSPRMAAQEFRESHKHAESVGICGDRPPPLTLSGIEIDRAPCDLKAGHTGMHTDGRGGHWAENPPKQALAADSAASEASEVPEGGHRDAENGTKGAK